MSFHVYAIKLTHGEATMLTETADNLEQATADAIERFGANRVESVSIPEYHKRLKDETITKG